MTKNEKICNKVFLKLVQRTELKYATRYLIVRVQRTLSVGKSMIITPSHPRTPQKESHTAWNSRGSSLGSQWGLRVSHSHWHSFKVTIKGCPVWGAHAFTFRCRWAKLNQLYLLIHLPNFAALSIRISQAPDHLISKKAPLLRRQKMPGKYWRMNKFHWWVIDWAGFMAQEATHQTLSLRRHKLIISSLCLLIIQDNYQISQNYLYNELKLTWFLPEGWTSWN